MIQVKIYRDKQTNRIVRYCVSGHAEFDESGKDIVCAGVSAVVVGTVNAIEALVPIQLAHHMENGLLDVMIDQPHEREHDDKTQLLLESMLVMLRTIEHSYGEYINITDISFV